MITTLSALTHKLTLESTSGTDCGKNPSICISSLPAGPASVSFRQVGASARPGAERSRHDDTPDILRDRGREFASGRDGLFRFLAFAILPCCSSFEKVHMRRVSVELQTRRCSTVAWEIERQPSYRRFRKEWIFHTTVDDAQHSRCGTD